jgi:hypothetical protein
MILAFILVMVMAGLFFFYPAKSPTPEKIKAPVETIQTPILPEITEDITPVFEDEEEDND